MFPGSEGVRELSTDYMLTVFAPFSEHHLISMLMYSMQLY